MLECALQGSLHVAHSGVGTLLAAPDLLGGLVHSLWVGQRAVSEIAAELDALEQLVQSVEQRGVADGRIEHLVQIAALSLVDREFSEQALAARRQRCRSAVRTAYLQGP